MDQSGHSESGDLKPVGAFLPGMEEWEGMCNKHGPYTDRVIRIGGQPRPQGCPCCLMERSAQEIRQRIEDTRRSARQNRAEAMLNRSGIPPRYKDASFDSFQIAPSGDARRDQQAAVDACKSFAERFAEALAEGQNLLMVGHCGTGKTHLACAISNHVAREGYSTLFMGAAAIARRVMKARYSAIGGSADEVIDELALLDLLIIDETESFHGEGAREILIEVINARYEQCRPIIAISNLGVDELEGRLSLRSVDRLAEDGQKIPFTWASNRRKVTPISPATKRKPDGK